MKNCNLFKHIYLMKRNHEHEEKIKISFRESRGKVV
jgi:hypothetical protein